MKVYISKYRYHWVSPYTICDKICFWREIDYDEPWVKFMNKLLEPVSVLLMKFLDIIHPRIEYIKIDPYDTWSMDSTLTPIILPMLKQIRQTSHGAPYVDDLDVPVEIRSTSAPPKENDWDTDEFHFKRWQWVIDQMIWAFENTNNDDWEDQFFTGTLDQEMVITKTNNKGSPIEWNLKDGPNHTRSFDREGYEEYSKRIQGGLVLFGKYYRALWT